MPICDSFLHSDSFLSMHFFFTILAFYLLSPSFLCLYFCLFSYRSNYHSFQLASNIRWYLFIQILNYTLPRYSSHLPFSSLFSAFEYNDYVRSVDGSAFKTIQVFEIILTSFSTFLHLVPSLSSLVLPLIHSTIQSAKSCSDTLPPSIVSLPTPIPLSVGH